MEPNSLKVTFVINPPFILATLARHQLYNVLAGPLRKTLTRYVCDYIRVIYFGRLKIVACCRNCAKEGDMSRCDFIRQPCVTAPR